MTRFAALALLASACVVRDPLPNPSGPSAPPQVADFTLATYPTMAPHDIKSDRGHVVLLDVWATWCEPCRDALPIYEDLAKEYGAKGLVVYTLNVDEDARQIPKFVAETKLTLPVLLDSRAPDGQTVVAEKLLKVQVMPTSFLIDRKGNIRHVHPGFDERTLGQYQAEIEVLLAEKKD